MNTIRIQARENVTYHKEMEVDDETLRMFRESLADAYATSSDFSLDGAVDIVDGELDDVEIDIWKDGKWVPVLPYGEGPDDEEA